MPTTSDWSSGVFVFAATSALVARRGVAAGAGVALGGVQLCVQLAWTGFALLAHLLVPARAPLDPGRGEGT